MNKIYQRLIWIYIQDGVIINIEQEDYRMYYISWGKPVKEKINHETT